MIKRFLILCSVFCLLSSGAHAANDFSADANCVSVWRFEDGALTTDSKGTNTLSSNGSPTADTVNYKEGAGSVDMEFTGGADYYTRAYADFSSNWPLATAGSPTKLSVCAWIRDEDPDQYCAIAGRWGMAGDRVWMVSTSPTGANDYIVTYVCRDGVNFESDTFSSVQLVPGQWYHVTWTWDNVSKAWNTYVYDLTATTLYTESGTFSNAMTTSETYQFAIGLAAADGFDGNIDEVVLFNDILSEAEVIQIYSGTYSGGAPPAGGSVLWPVMIRED